MKITTLAILAAVPGLGLAASANAQQMITIDWKANGLDNIAILPGQTVTVTGTAQWDFNPMLTGFAASLFNVDLAGATFTDGLNYTGAGLGRNASLSFMPQILTDMPLPGARMITANTGGIDDFQLPVFINPGFDAGNPIELFRFNFTAGATNHVVNVGSTHLYAQLYDFMGMSVDAVALVDGATISIVPAPGSLALLGLSGTLAARRRRSK
ncbi:MAG: PEP-CTERM sorting domain-containing protein [Phycisphaerales bacterium]|nr:PEP-CTERM sorting domain-containing protein [Phycisphaerales bacterium]